ncbi:hypothetical protein [Pinibacter aurantiacus]|uniref:Uncharacterized protein n=1 Tax=Pinibacter aurantiacus TaxID=2851599 RepID=A0A9E2SCB4_9BACT|nr:hypothetical protein [Pinibacter aurantiacus]MBV4357280.1 hypothetical protein [Pinibacter aurantiacus]
MDDKISQIIVGPNSSWKNLVEELKNSSEYEIVDECHQHFPSCKCYLVLSRTELQGKVYEKRLVLTMSFLVEYFTCYFEELVHFNELDVLPFRVIYNKTSTNANSYEEINSRIIEIASKNFSTHKYLDHYPLFSQRLDAVYPYTDDYTTIVSLFTLLFNGYEKLEQVEVFE